MVPNHPISSTAPGRHATLILLALLGCQDKSPDTATEDPCANGLILNSDGERSFSAPISLADTAHSLAIGDLVGSGFPQIYVSTESTLIRLDGDGWMDSTEVWTPGSEYESMNLLIADITGDGVEDLVAGQPNADVGVGRVLIFPGPIPGSVDLDVPHLELTGSTDLAAGYAVFAADLNGDTAIDLVTQGAGIVWISFGPILTDTPLGSKADAVFTETDGTRFAGKQVVGDITGDGLSDLILVVEYEARAFPGPLAPGVYSVDDAPMPVLLPPGASGLINGGWDGAYAWVEDVDGDGSSDFLALAGEEIAPEIDQPEMLVYGSPVLAGAEPRARFGIIGNPVGIGDLDGDGNVDLLQSGDDVAAWYFETSTEMGDLWTVLRGPLIDLPGYDTANCAFHVAETWTWSTPPNLENPVAAWVGDLDGDQIADAVIVTNEDGEESGFSGNGVVHVVIGGSLGQ